MTRTIEEWYLPTDGDDIGPAWDRMMGGGDGFDPIRTDDGGLGGEVRFGSKSYRTTRTLSVTRQVIVRGEGQINTKLLCVQSGGFHVRFRDDTTSPRFGFGGQESLIADMLVQYSGPRGSQYAGAPHHGIDLNARAHAERVHVANFPGNGVHILGDVQANPKTGANLCSLRLVRATGCDGAGYYMRGGDANANHFSACDATDCLAGGFWDDSFLGNFFDACHANILYRTRDWWCPSDLDGLSVGYRAKEDTTNASLFAATGFYYPHAARAVRSSQSGWCVMYAEGANLLDVRPPNFVPRVMGGGVTAASQRAALRMLTSGIVLPEGSAYIAAGGGAEIRLAPSPGVAEEMRSPLDTYGVGWARETNGPYNGHWTLRRANTQNQAVLAVRADGKTGATPDLVAPVGVTLGKGTAKGRAVPVVSAVPSPNDGAAGDAVLVVTPNGWSLYQRDAVEWKQVPAS